MSSVVPVANAFLELAEREEKKLTNMQLQKLVYIAHGYCLARLDRPLFYNNIHAFEWGPVVPKLYKLLRKYGGAPVENRLDTDEPALGTDAEEMEIVRDVWQYYGDMSGFELSDITHRRGSPWSKTWKTNQFGVISDDTIAEHYRQHSHERFAHQP